ncbi:MAG: helix-hairpin-helix domain-containing protein [Phycisphaeraceae bacterium]
MSRRVTCLVALFTLAMLALALALRLNRPLHREEVRPRGLGFRIDVNTADPATLSLLPGIGPKLGQAMVEHRSSIGPFTKPEDLDIVPRIGPLTVHSIRPFIRFK